MSFDTKANAVVEQAKVIAAQSASWIPFSARMFDQRQGIVARAFEDESERRLFYESAQYGSINDLLIQLMKNFGMSPKNDCQI